MWAPPPSRADSAGRERGTAPRHPRPPSGHPQTGGAQSSRQSSLKFHAAALSHADNLVDGFFAHRSLGPGYGYGGPMWPPPLLPPPVSHTTTTPPPLPLGTCFLCCEDHPESPDPRPQIPVGRKAFIWLATCKSHFLNEER